MTRLTSRLAVLAVVAVASPIPRAAAEAVTVIRAGRLVDVEKGEIRRDQIVVVRGSSAGNHSTFRDSGEPLDMSRNERRRRTRGALWQIVRWVPEASKEQRYPRDGLAVS